MLKVIPFFHKYHPFIQNCGYQNTHNKREKKDIQFVSKNISHCERIFLTNAHQHTIVFIYSLKQFIPLSTVKVYQKVQFQTVK